MAQSVILELHFRTSGEIPFGFLSVGFHFRGLGSARGRVGCRCAMQVQGLVIKQG